MCSGHDVVYLGVGPSFASGMMYSGNSADVQYYALCECQATADSAGTALICSGTETIVG